MTSNETKRKVKMKPKVFDAIAKLIRSRGNSKEGARLVLIKGISGVQAASLCNISPAAVSNAVCRFRKINIELRKAYEIPDEV